MKDEENDARNEFRDRMIDAKASLEQMKLCLYNGAVINKVNKKHIMQHRKAILAILNYRDLNKLIGTINKGK